MPSRSLKTSGPRNQRFPPSPTEKIRQRKPAKTPIKRKNTLAISLITAAAVAAVIGVITLINFRLEAKETARILSELAPMLNSQRFFVGIQLKPEGRDTLYAFDPETRTAANLGVLSNELIATVNPEKTRLFYLRKPVGLSVGLAQIFGKTIYSADGVVIEPKERKIRVPFHSLPGKPLSVGYGVTGIWGGSADRIFLSLLKSPGNVGSGGYIFYGDGQTLEDMSHVVFDLRDKKPAAAQSQDGRRHLVRQVRPVAQGRSKRAA